jgi:hypothetical protein
MLLISISITLITAGAGLVFMMTPKLTISGEGASSTESRTTVEATKDDEYITIKLPEVPANVAAVGEPLRPSARRAELDAVVRRAAVRENRLEALADPDPRTPPTDLPSDDPGSSNTHERRRQIQDEMQRQVPAFRECYELVLELEPELDDRLVFEFEVRTNGPEEAITTLLTIEAGHMEIQHLECFAEAAAELEMPVPNDGSGTYTIRYPIILASN